MILVTGATGFIVSAVLQRLLSDDQSRSIAVAVRRDCQRWPQQKLSWITGGLELSYDWSIALLDVSAVVHCAAHVHVMSGGNRSLEPKALEVEFFPM